MLNTSIFYPTIVGSKICRTYEPPAKTEMRADPVAWPAVSLTQCSLEIMMGVIIITNVQFQLTISLNSSEIITYVIYIHDKTMTTADYGGKLPKYKMTVVVGREGFFWEVVTSLLCLSRPARTADSPGCVAPKHGVTYSQSWAILLPAL